MRSNAPNPGVRQLVRGYRFLLAFYPARHRSRFALEMEQLVRDRASDAYARNGNRALKNLSLHLISDFIRTCPMEHALELIHRYRMNTTVHTRVWATAAGAVVAALVFLSVMTATLRAPHLYGSLCRITVERAAVSAPGTVQPVEDPLFLQTEFNVLGSDPLLQRVVQDLDLARVWTGRLHPPRPLTSADAVARLVQRLHVRAIPQTRLIDVAIVDEDPQLAAGIANRIGARYLEVRPGLLPRSARE